MASGMMIQIPESVIQSRNTKDHKIELEDITTLSFSHFIEDAKISPIFGNIVIKSYYQTSLLQTMANLIGSFVAGYEAAPDKLGKLGPGKLEEWKENIKDVFTGLTQDGAMGGVAKTLAAGCAGPDGDAALVKLPYILAKGLFSTKSGSTLQLPFPLLGSSTNIITSDGNYGWGQDSSIYSPFAESQNITGAILKTIAVNITPSFSPTKGGGEKPKISISFDLVNDSVRKWEKNKEFIKGVAKANMWLQYGLVQAPGALYDIKVGDYMSYFMCTGNIKATPKGTWRKCQEVDASIPDVFSITMDFSSLLNNNFNSWLWSEQTNGEEVVAGFYGGGSAGALTQLLDNAVAAFKSMGESGAKVRADDAESAAEAAAQAASASKKALEAARQKARRLRQEVDKSTGESKEAKQKEWENARSEVLAAFSRADDDAKTRDEAKAKAERLRARYNDRMGIGEDKKQSE